MLEQWSMWMHEDVLTKVELQDAGYQDVIVSTIFNLCSGVNSISQQFSNIS
jgi:hypothetical protein